MVAQALECLALLIGQVAGHGKGDLHVEGAGRALVLHVGGAHALEPENLARLGAGGNLELEVLAVRGRHNDLRTQARLVHTHRQVHMDVGPVAGVEGVRRHARGHHEVAAGSALRAILAAFTVAQLTAVNGTCGNLDGERLSRTRGGNAVAHLARDALQGLLERDLHAHGQVAAALRTGLTPTVEPTETGGLRIPLGAKGALTVQDGVDDGLPVHACPTRVAVAATAGAGVAAHECAVLERLVVLCTLLGVGEDFVGLADLLELLFVTACVRVKLHGKLAERLLDFVVGCLFVDTQDFV